VSSHRAMISCIESGDDASLFRMVLFVCVPYYSSDCLVLFDVGLRAEIKEASSTPVQYDCLICYTQSVNWPDIEPGQIGR
jgi:hypothetical protein